MVTKTVTPIGCKALSMSLFVFYEVFHWSGSDFQEGFPVLRDAYSIYRLQNNKTHCQNASFLFPSTA